MVFLANDRKSIKWRGGGIEKIKPGRKQILVYFVSITQKQVLVLEKIKTYCCTTLLISLLCDMVCASGPGEKNPGDGVERGATEGVVGGVESDADVAECGGATDCSCCVHTVRGCVTGWDCGEILGMAEAATRTKKVTFLTQFFLLGLKN